MSDIKNYKILIVDDSEFSRNTISKMLTEEGFNVVGEVESAKSAITFFAERSADIAIIDVVMPEVSGIELTQEISKSLPDLKVIMISALKHENIVIESISAGAADFLQKPFEKKTLFDSINKIIGILNQE